MAGGGRRQPPSCLYAASYRFGPAAKTRKGGRRRYCACHLGPVGGARSPCPHLAPTRSPAIPSLEPRRACVQVRPREGNRFEPASGSDGRRRAVDAARLPLLPELREARRGARLCLAAIQAKGRACVLRQQKSMLGAGLWSRRPPRGPLQGRLRRQPRGQLPGFAWKSRRVGMPQFVDAPQAKAGARAIVPKAPASPPTRGAEASSPGPAAWIRLEISERAVPQFLDALLAAALGFEPQAEFACGTSFARSMWEGAGEGYRIPRPASADAAYRKPFRARIESAAGRAGYPSRGGAADRRDGGEVGRSPDCGCTASPRSAANVRHPARGEPWN